MDNILCVAAHSSTSTCRASYPRVSPYESIDGPTRSGYVRTRAHPRATTPRNLLLLLLVFAPPPPPRRRTAARGNASRTRNHTNSYLISSSTQLPLLASESVQNSIRDEYLEFLESLVHSSPPLVISFFLLAGGSKIKYHDEGNKPGDSRRPARRVIVVVVIKN